MDCLLLSGLFLEIIGVSLTYFVTTPKPPEISYTTTSGKIEHINSDGSRTTISKSSDLKEDIIHLVNDYNKRLIDYNVIISKKNNQRFWCLGLIAIGAAIQFINALGIS